MHVHSTSLCAASSSSSSTSLVGRDFYATCHMPHAAISSPHFTLEPSLQLDLTATRPHSLSLSHSLSLPASPFVPFRRNNFQLPRVTNFIDLRPACHTLPLLLLVLQLVVVAASNKYILPHYVALSSGNSFDTPIAANISDKGYAGWAEIIGYISKY